MVQHFQRRNSPLKCVHQYPTTEKHRERFLKHGWNNVYVKTIQDIWNRFVDTNERVKLESVDEPFDEASELMLKCLHYVLIIGVKNMELGLDDFWTSTMPFDTVPCQMNLKVQTPTNFELNRTFQRYGHISWTLGNRVFIAGGLLPSQKRPMSVTCLNQELNSIIWTKDLLKMNNSVFSACDVLKDFCYIFGGRGSPFNPSDAFMKIDCDGNTTEVMETKTTDRPESRWGHTFTTYENDLFLIGGRNQNLVYDHVYEFSTDKKKWSLVKKLDFGIYSHSTVCWKGFLIINGGLKDFSKCQVNRDLILIQPAPFGSSLRQVPNLPNHYFGRFAHTSHITDCGKLLQVGGVVIGAKLDIVLTVIDINDIGNVIVTNYEANTTLKAPLVQHTSLLYFDEKKVKKDEEKIVVFGGGTNCFSFGMHVNSDLIKIDYS